MNKVLIAAAGVLILLVAATLLVTGLMQRKVGQSAAGLTPIPTQVLGSRGGTGSNGSTTSIANNFPVPKTKGLSENDKNRLEKFKQKLTYASDKFVIDYSHYLDQFYIQKKTADADAAIDAFLQENNVLDLKNQVPGLFVLTNNPTNIQISKDEELARNQFENNGGASNTSSSKTPKTQPEKDIAALGDLSQTLFSFEVPTLPPQSQSQSPAGKSKAPAGKGSTNCASANGNEKILCAAKAYDGLGYSNTGAGGTYGHPPSAWVAGYEGGDPAYRNLDCSGLVNVAMYKAFGQDMQAFSGTYYTDGRFRPVALGDARPGDIVLKGGPGGVGGAGHAAIFEGYDGSNLQVFNSAGNGVRSESGNWMTSGPAFQIVRYIGPGGTP